MTSQMLFWLACGSALVACFSAIGVRSLAGFSRYELDAICRRRNRPERLGQILQGDEQAGLAAETLQVIASAVLVGAAAWWTAVRTPVGEDSEWAALLSTMAGGSAALLAVELWIPWAIARLWAEPILFATWPLWRTISGVLSPLVLAARIVDTVLHRMAGRSRDVPDEESFEEEIRSVVTEGHREGLLEEDAREMIEGVIELGEVDVSQIMTPRTDVDSMPAALNWPEALDFVTRMGHSRIPVYDKNRDDIIGILYVKDLLPELALPGHEPSRPWTKLLREAYFVPETKPVDVLLEEFQKTRNHMAIVLDEYGGVSGVVTLEDVLEEIVGEIVDETDTELIDGIKQLDESTAECLGRVHIDEINERLDVDLPEDAEYDTIAGFVFSELGHVPVAGEQVLWRNIRVTVIEATRRRIERVRIEVLDRLRQETA